MSFHLETERLLFRDIQDGDIEGIFALDSDPEVLKYIGTPILQDLEDARPYLDGIKRQYRENGIGRWAMIRKSDMVFLGWCGLKLEKDIRDFEYIDLGYRLIREYWGNGYASEGAAACLKHGLEVLGYAEICGAAEAEHLVSNHILQKIGMRRGDDFFFEGKACCWYSATLETLK